MQSNRHIKAYTFIEMIIVMVISAIIVSMAFIVFSKVDTLSLQLKKMYQANFQLVLMDKLIYSDFEQADRVVKTTEGFECVYKNESHAYNFNDGMLIRTQGHQRDTFSLINEMTIEYTFTNNREVLIKDLMMKGVYEDEDIRLLYSKAYGADVLVNDDE